MNRALLRSSSEHRHDHLASPVSQQRAGQTFEENLYVRAPTPLLRSGAPRPAADELTQPSLGLSVPQRKMLRCCGTATSIDEIERLFAAEEAHYSRERFDRDQKLEQF